MISVIVPAHNPSASEVALSIESVRNFLPDAQIILVDDGSDSVVAADRADVIVRTEGTGPSGARNKGAACAERHWLLFLDDDDELLPGAEEFLHAARLIADGVGLICAAASVCTGAATTVERPKAVAGLPDAPRLSSIAGSFLVSKHVFDRVGGYDEQLRFGENTDLIIRCAAATEVLTLDVPTVKYYAQATERRYDQRRLDAAERILRRGRPDLEHRPTRASIHSIAAVNAARTGNHRAARRHAWSSLCTAPSAKALTRYAMCFLGPLSRRWWSRSS